MDTFSVITLVVIVALGAVLLLLTWGAYAGKTTLLWFRGVRPMIGGRYWFVLSPAILVGDVLIVMAMVLLEVHPETAGMFADSPGDPLPMSLILGLCVVMILALAASYWLPERLKPGWIREVEAQEAEAEATRNQARRRG
jgi:hypothetical protein